MLVFLRTTVARAVAIGACADTQGNVTNDHAVDDMQIIGDGCPPAKPSQISKQGNSIATDRSGLLDLGNRYAGISVYGATTTGMAGIPIGDAPSAANAGVNGNRMSGNRSGGMSIAERFGGVVVRVSPIGIRKKQDIRHSPPALRQRAERSRTGPWTLARPGPGH